MYDNIAEKIKLLAKVTFIVEALAAVITGFAIMGRNENLLFGFLVMVLGPCIAWVSSWVLYGFGELIDNSAKAVSNNNTNSPTSNNDLPDL